MVNIRSAMYTSSYTSGTLTISTPPDMVPGDLLVMFLVAQGVYWGTHEFGNPPDGRPFPPGGAINWPPGGPSLADYPHTPPVSTLSQRMQNMDLPYNDSAGGSGFYGNYWSNLGERDDALAWDTPGNVTVRQRWPFISSWVAMLPDARPQTPTSPDAMSSLTAVGRLINGTELSSYSFTLNNPLDSEYDYRGFALCFEPNDWSGNNLDNLAFGGTGSVSLDTAHQLWWPTTGARTQRTNVSTTYDGLGGFVTYNGANGYLLPSDLSYWPPVPEFDYPYIADLSTGQQTLPTPPLDLNTTDDLLLHILTYAGPTTSGSPATISVADLSATTHVDPLTVLHQEVWTKAASTLMVQVCETHVTPDHAVSTAGSYPGTGLIHLTARVFTVDAGPITAPTPDPIDVAMEVSLGLALTFRVRIPPPLPAAIPARLATIVG